MKTILFSLPGNEKLTDLLAEKINSEVGEATLRKFPDGESYTRILSDVKGKCGVLVCTLLEPDEKTINALFFRSNGKIIGCYVYVFSSTLLGLYATG